MAVSTSRYFLRNSETGTACVLTSALTTDSRFLSRRKQVHFSFLSAILRNFFFLDKKPKYQLTSK